MKLTTAFIKLACILFLTACPEFNVLAGESMDLEDFFRSEKVWDDEVLNMEVSLRIYSRRATTGDPAPVILYVQNHSAERTGTEECDAILGDFIFEDYIVVTADYGGSPHAVPPDVDWSLHEIRNAANSTSFFTDMGLDLEPKQHSVYVIPEGYRLERDLVYWEIDKHGVYGTLEYIKELYNDYVVENFDQDPVDSPQQMVRPDGSALDYKLRLDVVYPSRPEQEVPVVMIQSSSSPRKSWKTRASRPHYIGFKMRGYGFIHYDHNYQPLARADHYGYWHNYTLDPYNGLASNTAAVRFVRAHSDKYGLNADHIGVWGHSKASYGAALLSDPNHAEHDEWRSFSDQPAGTPEPQPWQGYSSEVSVGYQSMGCGTRRHRRILTSDYVPTIIASGENDPSNAAKYWPELAHYFDNSKVPHLPLFMEDTGHTFPHGQDRELGIDRYAICFEFFQHYLRPEDDLKPSLLYALPADGADDVSPKSPVVLRFAPRMDPETITDKDGTRIIRASDGSRVEGGWKALQRETLFRWKPGQPLDAEEEYKLFVTKDAASQCGNNLDEERTIRFSPSGAIPEREKLPQQRKENDLLLNLPDADDTAWPEEGENISSLPGFSTFPHSLHSFRIVEGISRDGSGRDYWRLSASDQSANIKINFGEPVTVSQFILKSGNDEAEEVASSYRLRYATDGPEDFKTAAAVTENNNIRSSVTFEPVTAQFFYIDNISRNTPVRIRDIEMYETPRSMDPELILTEPSQTYMREGEDMTLKATDTDGNLQNVSFYKNGREFKAAPADDANVHEARAKNIPEGDYLISAAGTCGDGGKHEATTFDAADEYGFRRKDREQGLLLRVLRPEVYIFSPFSPPVIRENIEISKATLNGRDFDISQKVTRGGNHTMQLAGKDLESGEDYSERFQFAVYNEKADWDIASGEWSVETCETSGEQSFQSPGTGHATIGSQGWSDYIIDSKVKIGELGGNFQFVIRSEDLDNYYRVLCRHNRIELQRIKEGKTEQYLSVNRDFGFDKGSTYNIRLKVEGEGLEMHVDGDKKLSYQNLQFNEGRIGLRTWRGKVTLHEMEVMLLAD